MLLSNIDTPVFLKMRVFASSGLRRLFAVHLITSCYNWMKNFVLYINSYSKQQTENNKTQIMFIYRLKTVTPCSKFCINISHLNESETLKTVMSEFIFLWRFFTWPRNYYNDNIMSLLIPFRVVWSIALYQVSYSDLLESIKSKNVHSAC